MISRRDKAFQQLSFKKTHKKILFQCKVTGREVYYTLIVLIIPVAKSCHSGYGSNLYVKTSRNKCYSGIILSRNANVSADSRPMRRPTVGFIKHGVLHQFHNGGCLAFMFSSFLMTLFLLPTERRNKIRVRKGKFFDECVGRRVGSVSVVCRPTRWPTCLPTRRWDRILYLYRVV